MTFPTDPALTHRINQALVFAARAHNGQVRKGTDVPYLVHPVGVMLILLEVGEAEVELLLAALLHDTVEDTPTTLADLEAMFGPRVAEIVRGCTEPYERKAAWEIRKQHTVEYLKTASRDIALVAAADKLHNLRSMVSEHQRMGEAVWQRFNRGQPENAWYYRSLAQSFQVSAIADHLLTQRFAAAVQSFFGEG